MGYTITYSDGTQKFIDKPQSKPRLLHNDLSHYYENRTKKQRKSLNDMYKHVHRAQKGSKITFV
jgi:hypothetical protein